MYPSKITTAIVAIALVAGFSSCKNDTEDDLLKPPPTSTIGGLYINEVFTSNPDWIELYNSSDTEIDLSNFILQDDKGAAEEYIIPAGTKIAAKSYLVFENGTSFAFGLSSSNGDKVTLFDRNGSKVDEVVIPVISGNKSYARMPDGGATWQLANTPTKGRAN